MDKRKIRLHHKWFGLAVSFFLLMFCLSGVLLNHREQISDINVSRRVLPSRYEYRNWNGGLLRGTLSIQQPSAPCSANVGGARQNAVLIYGASGMFLTDTEAHAVGDFNEGLPTGADYRQIRRVVDVGNASTQLFAVSPFALYRYGAHGKWHTVPLPLGDDGERLTDIAARGDTLVVLSRSYAYVATRPFDSFRRIDLPAPAGHKVRTTMFRTVWMLHSGELFGTVGKLIVDGVAITIAVLIVTGLLFFALKKSRRKWPKKALLLKHSLSWHNRLGRKTIVLTLLLCATGWCLRPPVMVPLALTKVPVVPFSTMDSTNPWHDRLRMIRYDAAIGDWLLSTSDGFYSLGSSIAAPRMQKMEDTPPVSVMGLNVWQQREDGSWLCGSFSGMSIWNRHTGSITDYFTGKPVERKAGPPFGKKAVAGYTDDLHADGNKKTATAIVTDYYEGTERIVQPANMAHLPMSLWNVALEVHSGRIYMCNTATYFFIFLVGLAAVWCLWTGRNITGGRKR